MSAGARASSRLLASRSVHLRIQPRPANLSESREIYRVLQNFGEISTYKYLRYEYHNPAANSAIAIYRDAESAQKALDASPLRFALEMVVPEGSDSASEARSSDYADDVHPADTPKVPRNTSIDEITRATPLLSPKPEPPYTSTLSSQKSKPPPMPFEDSLAHASNPPQTQSKWFQVTVDRSRVIHQDYVERQPYWKQFHPMKSTGQEDLAKTVPHVGLSDVSKRPPFAHRTPAKVLQQMSFYVENHMPSLWDMYEEGTGKGTRARESE